MPLRRHADGVAAGRGDTRGWGTALATVLNRELGPSSYRTRVLNNDVYINEGGNNKLTQQPAAMDAVLETIRRLTASRACTAKSSCRQPIR